MIVFTRSLCIFSAVVVVGTSLKCYECNSALDNDCGENLTPKKVTLQECSGESVKCGTQVQEADAEGWVGVIRACYVLGTLPDMDESNGCRQWTSPANYTARFCFCDTDGCNKDTGVMEM